MERAVRAGKHHRQQDKGRCTYQLRGCAGAFELGWELITHKSIRTHDSVEVHGGS